MNNWLSRKFQNQFKNQDITKTALSKLQQLEEQKNVSKVPGETPQVTLPQGCPNCSTLSGVNNTISVALSSDLLNNTKLNNVTTVEEICRDPGFQEFLSAQLNLYFKFIVNSSSNSILSSAKKRSFMDNGQSSGISVPDPGTSQYQSGTGCTTSQGESSRLVESQPDPALSLIEEEKSSEGQDVAVLCSQAQNLLKERSVSDNIAKSNQSVSSQPSRLTQHLKDKLFQKAVDVPKPFSPVSSKQINTAKTRFDTKFSANEETINPSVVDRSTRMRTNSVCSTAENTEQLSRSGRKRTSRTAAVDTAEFVAAQSEDEIFKKPLPPKRKAPSRSNNKRNTATKERAKLDEGALAELQQPHEGSLKAPIRQRQSVSRRVVSELSETTYRSVRGRVSKPPGDFWNPLSDDEHFPSQTRKAGNPSRKPRTKDMSKLSAMEVDKQSLRALDADVGSESGYSSVITERKRAQVSKVTRTELPKEAAEQSVTSKQALRNLRSRSAKLPTGAGTVNSVDAVEKREIEDTIDTKKATRGRLRKTASEDTVIEKVASSAPSGKAAAAKPSRPAPSASKPVQIAVAKNIFSDSNISSDDESDEVSDADRSRRQRIDAPQVSRQNRQLPNDKLSIFQDSSDEEGPDREPVRSRNTAVVSKLTLKQTRKEKVIVESSSDEEHTIVEELVGKKKQPAVRKPRQSAVTKQGKHLPEESPMVSQKVQSRPKGRFIFSGSSTEEESVCSYRTSDRHAERAGSESFEDDASYVSSTRSSREKEIRPEGNGNERRPAVVSRFRIRK